MHRSLQVAKICGALPLVAGPLIFAVWLPTRWEWLVPAGILVLYAGVLLFLIGTVALARFAIVAFREQNNRGKQTWRSIVSCSVLLLSNFVVAGGIISAVIVIQTSYVVMIQNRSPAPIE